MVFRKTRWKWWSRIGAGIGVLWTLIRLLLDGIGYFQTFKQISGSENKGAIMDLVVSVLFSAWTGPFIAVVCFIGTLWLSRKIPEESTQVRSALIKERQTLDSDIPIALQKQLGDSLQEYAHGFGPNLSNAQIILLDKSRRSLAETLKSVFLFAGWTASLGNIKAQYPQDGKNIEVIGYNKHLVEIVANALTVARLHGVRSRTEGVELILPDDGFSFRYNRAQHDIIIIVGYCEP
jgi:hypothetical protein